MTTFPSAGGPASPAGDLAWQALRALVIFSCGAGAALVFHSEVVAGAAVAAATTAVAALPALVAYGFGVGKTLRWHRQRGEMAQQLNAAVTGEVL